MQDDGNHCKHEQYMNQATCDVKNRKSTQPRDEKYDKQNHEYTHASPPLGTRAAYGQAGQISIKQ
jgi:hypothetical protein